MRLPIEIANQLAAELGPRETLLWSGRPRRGIVVRASEWVTMPFALMWGGFAVFWEWQVIHSNAPVFLVLWGVPFVLVGLYLIVGRFFVDARLRERTIYAVTNERILIVSGLFGRNVRSLGLRGLSDLSLRETGNGEGSILFGSGAPYGRRRGALGPRFELVANARNVYEIIREAQHAAK